MYADVGKVPLPMYRNNKVGTLSVVTPLTVVFSLDFQNKQCFHWSYHTFRFLLLDNELCPFKT